ncbi:hypothetical protein WDZ92_49885, partial [Nostoc sp. NIES-2111]
PQGEDDALIGSRERQIATEKKRGQGASIISWAITIVEGLELLTGFGPPYRGGTLGTGSKVFAILEEPLRSALPDCRLINTRHGLGDKNHAALGASQSDYICVSSPFVSTLFSRDYVVPEEKILVTGFPLMKSCSSRNRLHDCRPRRMRCCSRRHTMRVSAPATCW